MTHVWKRAHHGTTTLVKSLHPFFTALPLEEWHAHLIANSSTHVSDSFRMGARRAVRTCLLIPVYFMLFVVSVVDNHSIADAASLPAAAAESQTDKRATAVKKCTARAETLIPRHLRSKEVTAYCNGVTDIIVAVAQQVKRNMATGSESTKPAADSLHGRTTKGRKLIPGLGGLACHGMLTVVGIMTRVMMNVLLLVMQGSCIFM